MPPGSLLWNSTPYTIFQWLRREAERVTAQHVEQLISGP
jgi:hypothetical protein